MIDCTGHSTSHHNKRFYSDYFPQKNHHIFLLMEFWDDIPALDTIFHAVLERILTFEPEVRDSEALTRQIQDFFVKLNWQAFSLFRQVGESIYPDRLQEQGASLLFLITIGNEVYMVQFGRILCCLLRGAGDTPQPLEDSSMVGSLWRNFTIKSKEDMNLLGHLGEDIPVKVLHFKIGQDTTFLALSSGPAQRLLETGISRIGLPYFLQVQSHEEGFSYLLLEGEHTVKKSRKRFWLGKRFRISAAVIVLLMAASFFYFHRGKNVISDSATQTREMIQEAVTSANLLNAPAKKIELEIASTVTLPSDSARAVEFDQQYLFVALPHEVIAYQGRSNVIAWRIPARPANLILLDSSRLMFDDCDGWQVCVKRATGETVWRREAASRWNCGSQPCSQQVSRLDDRRLANSFLLVPQGSSLLALNFITSGELDRLSLGEKITILSRFDAVEKCVYVISGKTLSKVEFEIEL